MSGTSGYREQVVENVARIADRLVALFLPTEKALACEQYEEFCGCVSMLGNPLVKQRQVRICCGGVCGSCYETGDLC
ncbi:hypothetical protein ACQEVB_14670 [Pseudonocardia sp. CA-107938]|uniref:hypothetical protein n=1 Tax=Pseudonocardia sp. CA-107938 TaxID=3240021 RepID=UPI003D94B11F